MTRTSEPAPGAESVGEKMIPNAPGVMEFVELMVAPAQVNESAGPDQHNGVAVQLGPSPVRMLGSITKLPLNVVPIAGVPASELLPVTVPTKLTCTVAAFGNADRKDQKRRTT